MPTAGGLFSSEELYSDPSQENRDLLEPLVGEHVAGAGEGGRGARVSRLPRVAILLGAELFVFSK